MNFDKLNKYIISLITQYELQRAILLFLFLFFFIKTYLYRITHQPQAVLHEALSSHKSIYKT